MAAELDWRRELGKADKVFVDALLSSSTGVLDHASFHDACIARGMSTPSFELRAERSAVLENLAGANWCLRGTRVSPVMAAALCYARNVTESLP